MNRTLNKKHSANEFSLHQTTDIHSGFLDILKILIFKEGAIKGLWRNTFVRIDNKFQKAFERRKNKDSDCAS